ncbi:MAG: hypothetical protein D3910_19620, partial [Candidatus Electrothrix sp. ATG2]|nr:hypothetical protein [Candidatus Electrothrix sp. ATG2]
QRIWLVGNVDGYNYTDADSSSLSAELSDAESGSITGLHSKRDEYHADIVMFFSPFPGSTCNGLSYLQTTNNVNWNTNAFATMQACSFGHSIFAHELGHTMGSRHDWYDDNGTTPATIAHGHIDVAKEFRTIMSYNDRCLDLGFSCSRIPNFSNPAVSYDGAATGVPSGTSSACAQDDYYITMLNVKVRVRWSFFRNRHIYSAMRDIPGTILHIFLPKHPGVIFSQGYGRFFYLLNIPV